MARRKKKVRRFDAKGGSFIAEVISYSAACRARGLRRWGRRKSVDTTEFAIFIGWRDRGKHYGGGGRPARPPRPPRGGLSNRPPPPDPPPPTPPPPPRGPFGGSRPH